MLFSNKKRHGLTIPATRDDGKPANIAFLVDYLVKNLMKDPRKELFVLDNQVYVSSLTTLPPPPPVHCLMSFTIAISSLRSRPFSPVLGTVALTLLPYLFLPEIS